MMYGAIIGDVVGSRFEFNNLRSKDFETFTDECFFTDDTVATVAIALALEISKGGGWKSLDEAAIHTLKRFADVYPRVGWGQMMYRWLFSENSEPYNSFGNGAAMRISPVAWVAKSERQLRLLCYKATKITHDHPEGLKGAEATAMLIWYAKQGKSKQELKEIAERYYNMNFTLDEIRDTYIHNETCQDSVPQAIEAFLEGEDFEDVLHNAVSLGGDSDTIAAIAGSIAEAHFGVPEWMKEKVMDFLDLNLKYYVKRLEDSLQKEEK